ncbi:fungal-specific transcription factor domain-containing protein [Xylariaceae sp. FL0594]|nr:fungal-specific transcription factor domain-containing protein [Xylariaceae sp. FL0594]
MPFKRTRTGCLTCRGDGYKCDEKKPFCARCLRLGKECKGYGLQLKWQSPVKLPVGGASKEAQQRPARARTRTQSKAVQVAATRIPRSMSSELPPQHAYLLDHWTTSLAALISMAPIARNPFHAHITPVVFHSRALRSAVCSMAACHLGTLKSDDSLLTLGARHQIQAIASLRESLATEDPLVSLATISILQITDRWFNASFGASCGVNHLEGAKALIDQAGPKALDCELGRFLLSICCYHDAIISVSRRDRPVLGLGGDIPFIEGMAAMRGLKILWAAIGQISRMCSQPRSLNDSEGEAIKLTLQTVDSFASREGDAGHTVHAYKEASFIYLYRVWHEVGSPHPTTLKHARDCLDHLLQVPISSPLCSAHPWPLWTAACETIDPNLRAMVRERLDAMYKARHLPSLKRLLEDIEHVWEIKDAELRSTGVDSTDCVRAILSTRQREADLV